MSETKTRKAVVTTAEVQNAVENYTATRASLTGQDVDKLEFDKGARGKGFATYDASGTVVAVWETKEDALSFYGTWVKVATEVLSLQQTRTPESKTPAKKTADKPTA